MKKSLLLSAAALMSLASASAYPTEPKLFPDQTIGNISPDGRYVESSNAGTLTITDLDTGKDYVYFASAEGTTYYSAGDGNCWSANGILVGNIETNGGGAYWQNGEWLSLPNPENRNLFPKCVNPDGTIICATATTVASDKAPQGLNYVPLMWTLGEDGKWMDPVVLPYPVKDFTGRVPQMIIPLVISNDGKSIAAQMIDYSGSFTEPMLYKQEANGEWSYTFVAQDLINPDKLVFPEWDDDAPESPEIQDFISDPEKKAEWEALYKAWIDSQYQTPYPDPTDYLSYEDAVAYNEAVAAFNEKAEAYNEMLEKFMDVFMKAADKSVHFPQNNVYMNGDAGRMALSATRVVEVDPDDHWGGFVDFTDVVYINLTDGTYEVFSLKDHDNIFVSAIAEDGTFLAYTDEANSLAFIKQPGKDWENLYDWLVANSDEANEKWLKDNLLHTYDFMDPLSGESFSYVDTPLMEVSSCTPDLKLITTRATNLWDFENDPTEYYSYVIPTPKATVGIECVPEAEDSFRLSVRKGGVLALDAAADVNIYDMQGRLVYSAKSVNGTLNTGLAAGIYTIKATSEGQVKTVKAMF